MYLSNAGYIKYSQETEHEMNIGWTTTISNPKLLTISPLPLSEWKIRYIISSIARQFMLRPIFYPPSLPFHFGSFGRLYGGHRRMNLNNCTGQEGNKSSKLTKRSCSTMKMCQTQFCLRRRDIFQLLKRLK